MRDLNRTALVAGLLYVALGTLFLLDRLGVIRLAADHVWPVLLIGLGVALLAGGRRRTPPPQPASEPHAAPEPPAQPEPAPTEPRPEDETGSS